MVQAGLDFDVKAELEVGFGAFVERFVSRVEGRPGEMVKVSRRTEDRDVVDLRQFG